jgi:hypothetical protein
MNDPTQHERLNAAITEMLENQGES